MAGDSVFNAVDVMDVDKYNLMRKEAHNAYMRVYRSDSNHREKEKTRNREAYKKRKKQTGQSKAVDHASQSRRQ